jgi:uncharacterized repeat protein (TIGR01451 family)
MDLLSKRTLRRLAIAAVVAAAATVVPVRAQLPAPGVVVTVGDPLDPAPAGSRLQWTVKIDNLSSEPLEGVTVRTATPEGTTFVSVESAVGEWTTPGEGAPGEIAGELGTIAPGTSVAFGVRVDQATVTESRVDFVASIEAASGFALEVVEPTYLAEVGEPVLRWEPGVRGPADEGGPRSLYVGRVEPPPPVVPIRSDLDLVLEDAEYRVYRSATPGVELAAENLFLTLPITQRNTGSIAAETGYHYVVTSVFLGRESAPSNEVSFGAGEPTIERIKVSGSTVTVRGSGLERGTTVSVDGIEFSRPAKVSASGEKLVQKGKLSNGLSLKRYTAGRTEVIFCFREPSGATACVPYSTIVFN